MGVLPSSPPSTNVRSVSLRQYATCMIGERSSFSAICHRAPHLTRSRRSPYQIGLMKTPRRCSSVRQYGVGDIVVRQTDSQAIPFGASGVSHRLLLPSHGHPEAHGQDWDPDTPRKGAIEGTFAALLMSPLSLEAIRREPIECQEAAQGKRPTNRSETDLRSRSPGQTTPVKSAPRCTTNSTTGAASSYTRSNTTLTCTQTSCRITSAVSGRRRWHTWTSLQERGSTTFRRSMTSCL